MLKAMAIELIHGPPNSGRAAAVTARFREALGRQPLLVVPTADDVERLRAGPVRAAPARRSAARSPPSRDSPARSPGRTRSSSARPCSPIQRQALVRAAVRRAAPRLLSRSAARPGFAPAADRLIAELQAALVGRQLVRRRGRAARGSGLRARACGDLYGLRRAARGERRRGSRLDHRRGDRRRPRRSPGLGRAPGLRLRVRRPDPRPDRARGLRSPPGPASPSPSRTPTPAPSARAPGSSIG